MWTGYPQIKSLWGLSAWRPYRLTVSLVKQQMHLLPPYSSLIHCQTAALFAISSGEVRSAEMLTQGRCTIWCEKVCIITLDDLSALTHWTVGLQVWSSSCHESHWLLQNKAPTLKHVEWHPLRWLCIYPSEVWNWVYSHIKSKAWLVLLLKSTFLTRLYFHTIK